MKLYEIVKIAITVLVFKTWKNLLTPRKWNSILKMREKKTLYLALRNTILVLKESLMLIISFENYILYFYLILMCAYMWFCEHACVWKCVSGHMCGFTSHASLF